MMAENLNKEKTFPGIKKILVVGGGISGMTTAIEAAETGYEVVLVEKEEYLGGNAIRMNQYFPKLCPPWCGMEINFRRIKKNPRIQVLTGTSLESFTGEKGNFRIRLKTKPRYINDNCTLCGECLEACPVERNNPFNIGMDKTKAIYHPHEMAYPQRFAIDDDVCRGEECSKCVEKCSYEAIDLRAEDEDSELEIASIIIATGWEAYEAGKLDTLLFGQTPDVITSLMMERLAAPNGPTRGKIQRPSDGSVPKEIAFVQCAGSRDHKHLPYCSGVCCSASLKQALNLAEVLPEVKIRIHYIDLRVSGRNEDFLRRVEENEKISLVKGKVGSIVEEDGKIRLIAEDILSGKKKLYPADLVVLATGIQPPGLKTPALPQADNYEDMPGLPDGIYLAGCAAKPMDISASLKQSTGIALKAIGSLKSPVS